MVRERERRMVGLDGDREIKPNFGFPASLVQAPANRVCDIQTDHRNVFELI